MRSVKEHEGKTSDAGATVRVPLAPSGASAPGPGRRTSPSLLVTYHEVWPEDTGYLYSVTCDRFEEHLQVIRQMAHSSAAKKSRPQVCFDDGHVSNYDHALPLLEAYSLPGVFFVTAGFTGTREGFMHWGQLREIVSGGHEVQSHGWSHAHLTQCTDAELEEELARSRQTLEDKLGIAVDALSFPGGRWDERVLNACVRAGYKRVYASKPWLQAPKRAGLEFHGRLMVRRTMGTQQLAQLIRGDGIAVLRLRAQSALGETAKRVLGDGGYLALWRILARKQDKNKREKARI